jgi:hypothetical protein
LMRWDDCNAWILMRWGENEKKKRVSRIRRHSAHANRSAEIEVAQAARCG